MRNKKRIAALTLAAATLFTGVGVVAAPHAEAFYWCPGWFCRR